MSILGSILNSLDAQGLPLSGAAPASKGQAQDQIPLDLARAVLLVDLAFIDSKLDPRERAFITYTLKNDLGISQVQAQNLIQKACSMVQLRGSSAYAAVLKEKLSEEERYKLLAQLKDLMKADDIQDGFEIYLLNRLANSLGVLMDPVS